MIKALLCTAVAAVVACAGGSAANAAEGEPAPIDIRMSVDGSQGVAHVFEGRTYWVSRTAFDFTVLLTDVGDEDEQGVTVFLSVPDELDVQSWGDGWTCEDTEGGIDCHHPDLVVPGEAWPELYSRADPNQQYIVDSIDVYATTGDYEASHEGVHYKNDTST
ncbi:hypothetical protein [Lentzea albida]|uniref:PLAT/LH2 domain-containing protein n=1 Tax=Lentzea albida TaxID=65499 RepID=A0A1H9X7S9_9PSEU|nr:hypothetical protein [Lentzea albida]SES41927.1 hypothetical protein SAMN04488000_1297 [Lentzea albida]